MEVEVQHQGKKRAKTKTRKFNARNLLDFSVHPVAYLLHKTIFVAGWQSCHRSARAKLLSDWDVVTCSVVCAPLQSANGPGKKTLPPAT
jgi:hypothetical protein